MVKVLLVGGSGMLGSKVLRALVAHPSVDAAALFRDLGKVPSEFKSDKLSLKKGDVTDYASLVEAFQGIQVVVSALGNEPNLFIEGHRNIYKAATETGVKTVFPSDWSFDFFNLSPGEHINGDLRLAIGDEAKKYPSIQTVHFFNGCFTDVFFGFLGVFNKQEGTVSYFGDPSTKFDLTTQDDVALFLAEVVSKSPIPDRLEFVGDEISVEGVVTAFEEVKGRKLKLVHRGSIEDLKALIQKLRNEDPRNFYAYLPLMYQLGMFDGRGKLHKANNAQYPAVKAASLMEWLRSSPEAAGL
mmetsp:Transcript_17009/g.29436  ORF Transcript_17009/g.29436 Transcript_17009/m.29436 type:complete len:299 (+) Transcript_17009:143-1039(+)|eukprot:CAMPEP_0196666122 /NCGR_PEP_ID=MMETSP1086-20130531/63909_1 /TAXON_ID=77921 /ORGANISM="Cyanoptyche  gloeocystis , Strain SAG4.97" /LENGTH=298 /DNA_ID=CAMNT_0042003209 /DNA_START=142 /DNA_END=1038 /DNA_ORIENTATION=+